VTEITWTENDGGALRDEVLGRARSCDMCGAVIPLAMVALVARDERSKVIARACPHLYCRARLRERYEHPQEPGTGYVN